MCAHVYFTVILPYIYNRFKHSALHALIGLVWNFFSV